MEDHRAKGALILEDGTLVAGRLFGGRAPTVSDLNGATDRLLGAGEVVFNTAMAGYHEILTDPSYVGQIVTLTYPHAGNYGCSADWDESAAVAGSLRRRVKAQALVVRRLYSGRLPAGRQDLDAFLRESDVPGLTDADTRRITLRLRDEGAANGLIISLPERLVEMPIHRLAGLRRIEELLNAQEHAAVADYFRSLPSMEGRNLVSWVVSADAPNAGADAAGAGAADAGNAGADAAGTAADAANAGADAAGAATDAAVPAQAAGTAGPRDRRPKLCLLDYGAKGNIARLLESFGAEVTVLPGTAGPEDVRATGADGIVLSNGPGDPAVLQEQVATVAGLLGHRPMLGICLGHQLIAEAFEARTYKLPFGHHGANHPVADVETGRVFVTSQNHGFAVDPDSLPESVQLWLRNSNDGTVEGLKSPEQRVWSAQFHPEAAPGPWDCRFILEDYVGAVRTYADGSEEGHAYAGST